MTGRTCRSWRNSLPVGISMRFSSSLLMNRRYSINRSLIAVSCNRPSARTPRRRQVLACTSIRPSFTEPPAPQRLLSWRIVVPGGSGPGRVERPPSQPSLGALFDPKPGRLVPDQRLAFRLSAVGRRTPIRGDHNARRPADGPREYRRRASHWRIRSPRRYSGIKRDSQISRLA